LSISNYGFGTGSMEQSDSGNDLYGTRQLLPSPDPATASYPKQDFGRLLQSLNEPILMLSFHVLVSQAVSSTYVFRLIIADISHHYQPIKETWCPGSHHVRFSDTKV
jgi:hypothetical protein